MPLPCAGSTLENANNPPLKSVLAVLILREGEVVSEGTRVMSPVRSASE